MRGDRHGHRAIDHQRGAVLVVSLIVLLVLSLLALSGARMALLEERMAGNMRDRDLAFQAAEAALRDGEALIETVPMNAINAWDGSDGLYGLADASPDLWADATWASAQSGTAIAGVSAAPRFVIQHIETVDSGTGALNLGQGYGAQSGSGLVVTFRITARGTGSTTDAAVVLQSHYRRRF